MKFVVVDLETTGNAPQKGDRMIQIGIVIIENEQIVERFSRFINPECEIPLFIQQLTQIDEQMVKTAPVFAEIAEEIAEKLTGAYFVAHNVSFDWPFLQAELQAAGISLSPPPMIDTVEMARILFPTVESYKLSDLAQMLAIHHENPHQADSDAEVTAKLWLRLLQKLQSLPLATLQQLKRLSRDWKSDMYAILDAIIAKKMAAPNDEGYVYYRGIAIKKRTEPSKKQSDASYSFAEWAAEKPPLPFPQYEHRDGQWEMMNIVYEAFDTSQHAIIEAGTGIGKSLAYFIPSLYLAKKQEKPVVISTYTLQLQKQLIERDVPLLRQIVPFPFRVALLKGKRNYLSLDKFLSFLQEPNKTYDAVLTKGQVLVWLTETETGDVDELQLSSGGQLLWPLLHLDEQKEVGEHDFFRLACERASDADVVITNHAFLLQDITANTSLLPSYDHLIVDEAHHLEETASRYFGRHVEYVALRLLLTRIGTGDEEGSLFQLKKRLDQEVWSIQARLRDLQLECDEWFRLVRRYVLTKQPNANVPRLRYRFDPEKEYGRSWEAMKELLWRIADQTKKLADEVDEVKRSAPTLASLSFFSDIDELVMTVETLREVMETTDPLVVRWMEVETKGAANATAIYSQPIDVESFFAEELFAKKKSVVLTSATLSMNGSFSYVISRLGLEDFYPICRTIPSPFPYAEQVKVMVPRDLPSVSAVSLEAYAEAVASHVLTIAKHLNRKILVLFTSYELLKMTAAIVKERNDDETFVLLAQGGQGGSAAKLTKAFQQFEKAMLFGTSSFWEGIDLPGEALSVVVIVRLPFAPPDDPVMEAKSDYIRAKGGNPFYDLSLPQAVIRFKQGFGRLIRTKDDRGVLFVFDRRLITASYGRYFLASLPDVPVYDEPLEQLLQKMG